MNLTLSPEQQEAVITEILTTDYTRILSGYYEAETLQYREAFEKIMGFYLTDVQLKEMIDYSWRMNK